MIGIIYGLYFEKSIAFAFALFFIIYIFFIICRRKNLIRSYQVFRYSKIILKYNAIILFCFSALISNTYLIYLNNKYEQVYKENKSKINTTAVVISDRTEKEYIYKYVVKVKEGKYANKKIILNLKKNEQNILQYGDLINLEGEYLAPNKARNYKGFNYADYLKSKNIYGTISANKITILKNKALNIVLIESNRIRNAIIKQANKLLPNQTNSLLLGILIGSKEGIQEEELQSFRKANLSHILAVSGAHTSYIILRCYIHFNKK